MKAINLLDVELQQQAAALVESLVGRYGRVETVGLLAVSLACIFHEMLHEPNQFWETNIMQMCGLCDDLKNLVKMHEPCAAHVNGQHQTIPKDKMS